MTTWTTNPLPPSVDVPADPFAGGPGRPVHEAAEDRTEHLEREVAQLRHALRTRPQIDHVVGMLMLLLHCSDEVAWSTLSRVSQNTNRKVVDVAEAVARLVATGATLPDDLVAVFRHAMPAAPPDRSTPTGRTPPR